MIDLEKLGAFYLGREHDLQTGKTGEAPVMYDAAINQRSRAPRVARRGAVR
jgi:hypothetical protein